MAKLESLTKEQEARLPEICDEWIAIGLSTEPLDFGAATDAVNRAYRVAGLEPPKLILQANNPLEAVVMLTMLSVEGLSSFGTEEETHANLIRFFRENGGWNGKYNGQYQQHQSASVAGGQDAGWLSYYATFLEFGIEECRDLVPLMDLAKVCGWWIPYENVAVLQHRPLKILFDDQNRLHCDDGPAISYRAVCEETRVDIYAVHGVPVTREIIEGNYGLQDIRGTENAEVRRVMVERYGVERYAIESGAVCIHTDSVPVTKGSELRIPRALFKFEDGSKWLYGTDGSTSRCYWMPVPTDVSTCRQAHFAISGFDDAECVAQS